MKVKCDCLDTFVLSDRGEGMDSSPMFMEEDNSVEVLWSVDAINRRWQLVWLVELTVCHHAKKDIIGTILSTLTPVPILALAAEALFLNVSG